MHTMLTTVNVVQIIISDIAHTVYITFTVFWTFRNCCFFCTFWFLEASTPMMRTMVTMVNIVQIITSDVEHTMYITFTAFWKLSKLQFVLHILAFTKFLLRWRAPCKLWWTLFRSSLPTLRTPSISDFSPFETFRNCSLFCTFWLLYNLYCGDEHHANHGLPSSNHHFRHCAHCLYHIYSVLKLCEIAVCFANFGFYEFYTPMMRTMVSMVNVVQIIISDIAHTVYITITVFWNFSKLLFGLHQLASTKFVLRWCAPC